MRITPALIISLAALPAAAGNIYKWTDAQGQVHYTQTPPARGPAVARPQSSVQPGVSLQAPPPPPAPPPAASTAAVGKPPAPETAEAKTRRCEASKQRLEFLEENPARRLMVQSADGSEARMTEEQHEQSVTKAREAGKGC
ncbi:MAG: DUF4124 domain-containing protein [Pseudomonadota bacterium]